MPADKETRNATGADPDLPDEVDFSGGVRGRHGPRQVAALLRYERGPNRHANDRNAPERRASERAVDAPVISQVRTKAGVTDWSDLVGKFFHTFDTNGKISNQGVVLASLHDSYYVVGHFDWLTGSRAFYGTRLVHLSTIASDGWAFYADDEAMREAFEYGGAKPTT